MPSLRPIILVEDNPDDEALALRALRQTQLLNPIQIARSGEEAMPLILAAKPPPCVVLLDLKLPKIEGLDLLRQLRAHPQTQRLPVVVLTSSNETQDIVESYHLRANAYVHKPVDFDEFATAIAQVGMFWALLNELPQ